MIFNLATGMEMPFQHRGGVYALWRWIGRGDPKIASEALAKLSAAKSASKGESLKPSLFGGR